MSRSDGEGRRLTEREYWDSQYARRLPPASAPPPQSPFKRLLKRLLGAKLREWMRDYREYLLWDVIYRSYLQARRGATALEVGSAPGAHLIQLHKVFGLEPYGVEYSEQGVRLNREEFQKNGIDPGRVLHADFFSEEFQRTYAGFFDVVVSRGFVEHFTDVKAVVAAHVRLLAPGGLLLITIPNLRGVNYFLQRWFNRAVLPLHNLAIMRRSAFTEVFAGQGLSTLRCGYFGTFSFGVFAIARTSALRHWTSWLCWQVQPILNMLFRAMFGVRGAETAFASPYLIYIGQKDR